MAYQNVEQRWRKYQAQDDKEGIEAKRVGMATNLYRLLKAMEDGDWHLYRELPMGSCVYSNLAQLGRDGYVIKDVIEIDGKDVVTLRLSAQGKKLLKKAQGGE